jgi:hypothetical protein
MAAPKLKLSNYARPEPQSGGQNYYRWKVFVDAPESVMAEIKEVEYTLHPTFPDPVRTSRDRSDRSAEPRRPRFWQGPAQDRATGSSVLARSPKPAGGRCRRAPAAAENRPARGGVVRLGGVHGGGW